MSCPRSALRRSPRSRVMLPGSSCWTEGATAGRMRDSRICRGDCVVVNESRVIPARLLGLLEGEDTAVELLMVRALEGMRWEALVRPGRRLRVGARVSLAHGAARVTVLDRRPEGARVVEIEAPWPVKELLERHGLPPLPPYIARHDAPK